MTTLLEWQRALQSGVLEGSSVADAAPVHETDTASSAERMAIYVHGYRARFIEVLGQDFPGLRTLLGEDEFDRMCRDYVEATPSRLYNIRWYGAALAEFIHATSPWREKPALEEMARFEWNLGLAFDAADDAIVSAASFQDIPASCWPTMGFRLCASLRRCVFHWNVAVIRKALDSNDVPPHLMRMPGPQTRAIYRKGITVFHRAVEPDEAAALDVVAAGGPFADVCETLCEWHPIENVAAQSLSLLKRWIDDGWIASLLLSSGHDSNASDASRSH